jgi:hypothetical protein
MKQNFGGFTFTLLFNGSTNFLGEKKLKEKSKIYIVKNGHYLAKNGLKSKKGMG